MANQLKLTANIAPATAAVEASTDSGATFRAVTMTTNGTQQEGVLSAVAAGTYAAGAVKLRAVGFPNTVLSWPNALTVLDPVTGLPLLKFTSAAVTSQQITSYLPPNLIASNVSFAATNAASAVTCASSPGGSTASVVILESEGPGWASSTFTTGPTNNWQAAPANAANRNTGSMYGQGGPGFPLFRTENCQFVDVFAQQDPTLGTLVLRLTRNGAVTTYPFPQSGTANSGAPNGTTPQISVDLGSADTTLIELCSAVAGQYAAFDAIQIRRAGTTAPPPTPVATPITAGQLQLAPAAAGLLSAVLPTKPVGAWWTVEADIASAAAPTGITTADLFIGQYLNPDNYVGALFHATTGIFQAVARLNGSETRSVDLGGGITLPGSIKVVCTGIGLTVLYRNGTGPWLDLTLWNGPVGLLQDSHYGATGWPYGAFVYTSQGGWNVQISNLRAGYFGAVCVGDNSMLLEETGQPVLLNGKRYWSGSLRGFSEGGATFPNFIRNNMCGILSEDVVTGVHELVSLVFHRHGTELQGEGSPCFVREAGAGLFHSFTPAWHLATTNYATETRNAYGRTTAALLTPGAYVIDAALRIYDAAKPNEMAYDTAWTKLANGNWRGCTTVQYAGGEQSQGFQMYGKVVNSVDLTQNVFTIIVTDTTTGTANAYEGWRLLLYNGERYFVGAGYTKLRVLGLDGLLRGTFDQPTAVQGQQYASHFAAYQTTVNGDPNRVHYIAFDGTLFRPSWQYAYGTTKAFLSDPL